MAEENGSQGVKSLLSIQFQFSDSIANYKNWNKILQNIEVAVVWCNPTAGTNKSKNEDDMSHEINIGKDKLVCCFCWLQFQIIWFAMKDESGGKTYTVNVMNHILFSLYNQSSPLGKTSNSNIITSPRVHKNKSCSNKCDNLNLCIVLQIIHRRVQSCLDRETCLELTRL